MTRSIKRLARTKYKSMKKKRKDSGGSDGIAALKTSFFIYFIPEKKDHDTELTNQTEHDK